MKLREVTDLPQVVNLTLNMKGIDCGQSFKREVQLQGGRSVSKGVLTAEIIVISCFFYLLIKFVLDM